MFNMQFAYPTWATGNYTATAGTVITAFVPPVRGTANGAPLLYQVDGSANPLWVRGTGAAVTHLNRLLYTTGTTAHTVTVLRPLNWTYFTTAIAKNVTAFTGIAADPGVYSTNYKYPLPAGQTGPANVADNAIASGDYIMYQLVDGTWVLDTAGGSFSAGALTVTTGTPNITGGGIAKNSVLFFFGATGDTDPATNQKHFACGTTASTTKQDLLPDQIIGSVAGIHPGDPLVVVSNNATAAGTLDAVIAYYARN